MGGEAVSGRGRSWIPQAYVWVPQTLGAESSTLSLWVMVGEERRQPGTRKQLVSRGRGGERSCPPAFPLEERLCRKIEREKERVRRKEQQGALAF